VLAAVIGLASLCLFASVTSVIQMTQVSQSLDAMNQVVLPLGKQLLQLEADTEVLRREADRRMGRLQWEGNRGTLKSLPTWLIEVLRNDIDRISAAVSADTPWADRGTRDNWRLWSGRLQQRFKDISRQNEALKKNLSDSSKPSDEEGAVRVHRGSPLANPRANPLVGSREGSPEGSPETEPQRLAPQPATSMDNERAWRDFSDSLTAWYSLVRWGATEQERLTRRSLGEAQASVSQLRTALESVLAVVLGLSLLVVWLGDRALRPLAELTRIARDITARGLKQHDKAKIGFLTEIARDDEVSTLAREFHRMATALLERGRTVEQQTERLAAQNRLLEEMGELNASILRSIHQILIVFDSQGKIQLANPAAQKFLLKHEGQEGASLHWKGYSLAQGGTLAQWIAPPSPPSESSPQVAVLSSLRIQEQTYSGAWVPLSGADRSFEGQILILEEITEKLEIESRLKSAENLAAIGRMSAQVAHEIRNPLHSIGLEAELALELAQKRALFKQEALSSQTSLQNSMSSILKSVDRLEKITGNYLKLSKLSTGKKERVDLVVLLEEVLASYAPVCEAQGVLVNWSTDHRQKNATMLSLDKPGPWLRRRVRRQKKTVLSHSKQGHGSVLSENAVFRMIPPAARLQRLELNEFPVLIDRSLIENALGNLFKNALQAVEGVAVPRIEIRIGQSEKGFVQFRIEDNGPGIRADVRDRLFTPFVTSKAQGTGLGLSFSKKVIEDHGGELKCVSARREGLKGACFELQLPCALPALYSSMPARNNGVELEQWGELT
jgi:nitrogen fixation/metabolism regulation signal transduction histidine kinase